MAAAKVRPILGKILYWLAVLVISLALLVGLVLFFESRDESTLGSDTGTAAPYAGSTSFSSANTTIRWAAL